MADVITVAMSGAGPYQSTTINNGGVIEGLLGEVVSSILTIPLVKVTTEQILQVLRFPPRELYLLSMTLRLLVVLLALNRYS